MDKALLVFLAVVISAFIGSSWKFIHKMMETTGAPPLLKLPAKLLRDSERKLNKDNKTNEEKSLHGAMLTSIVIAGGAFFGWLFSSIFTNHFFTIMLLTMSLPVGSSWWRVNALKKHLQSQNLTAARAQLDGTVCRHHAILDSPSLARAAIEYLTVQFFQKVITPIFWFFILGVAGLFASIALNFLYETLVSPTTNKTPFNKPINNAATIFNYLPSRLAAFFWLSSTFFLPNADWRKITERTSTGILSEAPISLALLCTASGLNLSLGGKMSAYYSEGWIGTDKIALSTADITRTQFLFAISTLLLLVVTGIFI